MEIEFGEPARVSPDYIVTKSNILIETPLYLDLHENRLVFAMIALIQPDDEQFNTVVLRVKSMAEILEIDEKNYYKKVKLVVDRLLSKTLTINENNGDTTLKVNWLSAARYHNKKGIVELEFSPQLRPYLLQLKKDFTKYKLGNVLLLRSKYSIKMYELLKRYLKIGKRRFTLEQLRYLLEIEPDKLTHYGHFKSRVLLKAQEELARKTDISFDFEETKIGNRVTSITCLIKEDRKIKLLDPEDSDTGIDETTPLEFLKRFGVHKSVALELIQLYGEERVKDNIRYVYETKRNEDVDNISGYIVRAIRENYVCSSGGFSEEDELDMHTSILQLNERIRRHIHFYGRLKQLHDPPPDLETEMGENILEEINKSLSARKELGRRPLTLEDFDDNYARDVFKFISEMQ